MVAFFLVFVLLFAVAFPIDCLWYSGRVAECGFRGATALLGSVRGVAPSGTRGNNEPLPCCLLACLLAAFMGFLHILCHLSSCREL
jgi:hypothetical protein